MCINIKYIAAVIFAVFLDGGIAFSQSIGGGSGITNVGAGASSAFQATPKWNAAKAAVAAGTRNALVAFVGSSITSGAYALTSSGSSAYNGALAVAYPTVLATSVPNASVQTVMGTNGVGVPAPNGWAAYDTRMNPSANWETEVTNGTIGASTFGNPTDTGALAFTPTNSFDSADIYYLTASGLGSFNVNVDGGSTLATINQNVAASFTKTTVTFTLGTHTFNFVRNSGNPVPSGLVTYNSSAKQVSFVIPGWNGGVASNFAQTTNPYSELNALVAIAPDLVVIELGVNDWGTQTNLTTFTTNVQSIITALAPTSDIIIVISPPSSTSVVSTAIQNTYVNALVSLGSSNHLNVVNLPVLWGSWVAGNANGWYQTGVPGEVHPNSAGYAQMASNVLPYLLQ